MAKRRNLQPCCIVAPTHFPRTSADTTYFLECQLLAQRRHGCGAAGRYEMSPIDAEADHLIYRQIPLNRVGDISVYLTVCVIDAWPR
jgi:hypothetical protein